MHNTDLPLNTFTVENPFLLHACSGGIVKIAVGYWLHSIGWISFYRKAFKAISILNCKITNNVMDFEFVCTIEINFSFFVKCC